MIAVPDTSLRRVRASWIRRWPLVVSLVATLGFLGITIALLLDLKGSIETRARDNASNLLKALERDVARNIEVLDLSLQATVAGLGRAELVGADPAYRNVVLFNQSTKASGLGALLVYDRNGALVFDSTSLTPRPLAPATDREYFQAQRDADRGLFISTPYTSRVTHTTVIGLSRRVPAPDGGFGGVVIGSIETSYFAALFDKLQLGRNAVVSLVREDGTVLLRQQNGASLAGTVRIGGSPLFERLRAERAGTVVGHSPIDGEERLYAFTQVGDRPVYLSVGLTLTAILSEWRDRAALLLTLALVISMLLVALTVRLMRELARRGEAERTLARLNAELAQLSVTDALTGVGNRRAFDAALAREIRRMRRTGRPLGLVMVDIDYFKLFNDRYGHGAGDRTLSLVAEAIRPAGGPNGEGAFRLGGEEFAILLPGADLADSLRTANGVRDLLRTARHVHEASPFGIVTASFGVTQVGEEDAAAALARADELLYAAKRAGRDRCVAAGARGVADQSAGDPSGMNVVTISRRRAPRADAA